MLKLFRLSLFMNPLAILIIVDVPALLLPNYDKFEHHQIVARVANFYSYMSVSEFIKMTARFILKCNIKFTMYLISYAVIL